MQILLKLMHFTLFERQRNIEAKPKRDRDGEPRTVTSASSVTPQMSPHLRLGQSVHSHEQCLAQGRQVQSN